MTGLYIGLSVVTFVNFALWRNAFELFVYGFSTLTLWACAAHSAGFL